ncbi:MAG: ABC transporter ATP-binding protein [Pseudomonadota bacterium]
MTHALTLFNVASGYGAVPVLHDVSLNLNAGEITAVLGKNGMGKTTLLKTIMGFLRAAKGSITLFDDDITGRPPHTMAARGVAYAPQDYTLFQDLTVAENLRLGVADDKTYADRLDGLADLFPRMLERLKQRAGTLSGGEQKMLLMSRAILSRPRILLVDEISEGLQPTMIERMADVLKATQSRDGTTVLLVEQHLDFALSVANRYAILKLGTIVEEGAAADRDSIAQHLAV